MTSPYISLKVYRLLGSVRTKQFGLDAEGVQYLIAKVSMDSVNPSF